MAQKQNAAKKRSRLDFDLQDAEKVTSTVLAVRATERQCAGERRELMAVTLSAMNIRGYVSLFRRQSLENQA